MFKKNKILIFIMLILVQYSIESSLDLFGSHTTLTRSHHRSKRIKVHQSKRTLLNDVIHMTTTKSDLNPNSQRDYVSAIIGKDVQLDCKMTGLEGDDEKIVWLKMPKGEVLALNSNRVTSDSRISTKCSSNFTPCWSLIITDVKESDSGFYVCQTNAMQNKYVYLDIMVPPKLMTQYPLERIDVNQSSHFTLTCDFYGKPEPLIKWYKYQNGIQKEIEKFRGSNKINLLIHKDSPNEYECVADNSIPPTVSKKIYLNIQYPPQIKFLNSKLFQKKGERVILDCKVNSNPKCEIQWFKNETRIKESSKYVIENLDDSYNRLFINNLTDSDFTDYHCVAINILGKSTARTELVELKTISVTDSARIFTTKIPTTIEIIKLNETVIPFSLNQNQNDVKSTIIFADTIPDIKLETTTFKNRNSKGSIHRSNKHNNQSKAPKIHQKQQVQNLQRNFFSTTKLLQNENGSLRINSNFPNIFICIILFFFKSILD